MFGEMAEIIYVRDANWNLVQTTIKDLREYELEQLEKENKKLKEERDFFYKSAKQFREQVEKWEKDFVEWRIIEKE